MGFGYLSLFLDIELVELLVLITFFCLIFKSYHILSLLIGLEMVVLFNFIFIIFFVTTFSFYVMVFYIAVTACESVLGLVLFVFFNRIFSKDYIFSLSILQF